MGDKPAKPTLRDRELERLRAENESLRAERDEARETLAAIQGGAVDALVIDTPEGQRIFTLEGTEHSYRAMIEQMAEGAVVLQADGTIHYCNRGFAEMLGRPLEQIIGTPAVRYISAEQRPVFEALLRQGRSAGTHGEVAFLGNDGRAVPVQVGFSPLVDTNPVAAVSLVVTNLTERKRAEHVLASAAFTQRLIDSAPIGVAVVGKDLRYRLANPTYQAIAGEATASLTGRSIAEVFPPVVAQIVEGAVQQVLDSGQPAEFREYETPIRGRTWWTIHEVPLRDAEGHTEAVLILTEEVTSRKQAENALRESEHKYRSLFENSVDAIFLAVPNQQVVAANPAACALFGMTEEELCRVGRQGIEDPSDPRHAAAVAERARTGKVQYEATHVRKDGSKFPSEVSSVILDGGARSIVILRDLTARKRAEEELEAHRRHLEALVQERTAALRKSQDLLNETQRVSKVGGWEFDVATRRVFWTDEVYRLHEVAKDYDPSNPEQDMHFYAPEDQQRIAAAFQRAVVQGEPYDLELELITARGNRLWVRTIGQPERQNGKVVRVSGNITDISERKHAEAALQEAHDLLEQRVTERTAALRESEERLRQIAHAASIGLFEWNASRDTAYWSPEHYELFGWDPGSPITWDRWLQGVHPEDRRRVAQNGARLLEQGRAQGTVRGHKDEYRFVRADGSVIWLESNVALDTLNGDAILRGSVRDITERKRAEEALAAAHRQVQSLIDNTPAIVYAFDLDERFLLANTALAALFNTTPEQIIGRRRHEFMPQADADWHEANDRKAIEAGQAVEFEEHSQLPGRSITWLTTKFPLRDEQGKTYAVAGISANVSARKQAEEELKVAKLSAEQAQAVAEKANKAKDQFIAVLSHELRTPLTPALAAVALLAEDDRLPGDVREDLAMVRRNIALEVRLIADLLDVSRIISGKLHLEKRPVDVAATIRESAKIVGGDLDAKGQTLVLEIPETPFLTFADAARLQQVFWNLFRNAIKFSPDRGTITVRARTVSVDHCPLAAQPCPVGQGECPLPQASHGNGHPCGGNLVIEVLDQGVGIAPAMLPRLFNAFEQDPSARSFGGLGLGLSICRTVVEMHGGTIAAASAGVGCGATFTVQLPVAQCPRSFTDRLPLHEASEQTTSPQTNASPLRILLVEDHADTAKIMTRLLRAEGYDVATAGSVAAGLSAVRHHPPEVVISDIGLPDGSGLDLMRQLRAEGHHMPAIALSGYGTAGDIEQSRAAGFAEHLVKPLGSVDLLMAALLRLGVCRGGGGRNRQAAGRFLSPPRE